METRGKRAARLEKAARMGREASREKAGRP